MEIFSQLFTDAFLVALKFDWIGFFSGMKEVVDIIWASLSETYNFKK